MTSLRQVRDTVRVLTSLRSTASKHQIFRCERGQTRKKKEKKLYSVDQHQQDGQQPYTVDLYSAESVDYAYIDILRTACTVLHCTILYCTVHTSAREGCCAVTTQSQSQSQSQVCCILLVF